MQCKDIPELPILKFIDSFNGEWCNWFGKEISERSVLFAMPEDVPGKLAHAKMNNLIKRGLVDGCPCGCRGDYYLTDKGKRHLKVLLTYQ